MKIGTSTTISLGNLRNENSLLVPQAEKLANVALRRWNNVIVAIVALVAVAISGCAARQPKMHTVRFHYEASHTTLSDTKPSYPNNQGGAK
jgi:hypothetical protein